MKSLSKKITASFLILATIVPVFSPLLTAEALISEPGFELETVASGFILPTAMTFAEDGRIFVAEKGGTVRVVENGVLLPTPVITLTDINTFGDRGLLGIAADPNFMTNGYLYLSYTFENTPGANVGGEKTGHIARVTVVGNTADETSKVVLVGTVDGDSASPSCEDFAITDDCIPSDSPSHSVGGLRFGPDGKLYATLGDGAHFDYADVRSLRAQNIDSLAGKMIRINADGTAPTDNPFYNGDPTANRSKVFALGLRNSFRFNFNPTTGALFAGDVGWSNFEELNHITAGSNYGWPCIEGNNPTTHNCTPSSPSTGPTYAYPHDGSGAGSVTAGAFPSNNAYPDEYDTSLFLGDYAQNWMRRIVIDGNNSFVSAVNFDDSPNGPVDVSTGPDGMIYYLSIYTGELNRLTHTSGNRRPVPVVSANPTSGLTPLTVDFSSTGSYDPDGDALTYEWNFGDGAISNQQNPSHDYVVSGSYNAVLTLTDSNGSVATKSILITVGNQAPQATITSPASGSLYVPNQVIDLSGTAVDLEDGTLAASQYSWRVILHHNVHIHIMQEFDGVTNPSFIAPDHNATDVYTEIELTVTDSAGLTDVTSVNLYLNNGSSAGNLIANHSLEVANETSGQPLGWHQGWFGNLNAVFTYPVAGFEGSKAAKVEVTGHTDGDAKWYFDPVSVTPGQEYAFSDKYTATAETTLFAQLALSNGTYQYIHLATLPPVDTPTAVNATILVSPGVQTMTVFHQLGKNGSLTVDDYSLTLATLPPDNIAPSVSVTSPADASVLSGTVTVDASATDNVGVSGVTLLVDGIAVGGEDVSAPYSFSLDTTTITDGSHTIAARARDAAGNEATSVVVTVSIANVVNLVSNPDFEIANGATPLDWSQGGWGNHTRVFTYPVVGYNGQKAARVDITAYPPNGDGDSKWAFTKVAVTPGVEYTFSDHYRSNTISDIIGQYTLADGSFHYFGLAKEIQPNTSWQTISATFTPPATATHVTFFHLISAVGYLEIDDVDLHVSGAGTPSETNTPIVEFTNPLANQTVSGTVGVTASSTDDTAVTYIFYAVDGIPVTGQITAAPYLFNWDTTTVSNGPHTLKATTHDPSGNNSTHTITVNVDNTTPPPTSGNLILNPSLETDAGNGNPTNWSRGGWGTNNRAFTYPVAGVDGVNAAKVEITTYTNGDAKWFFDDVSVVPGTTYQYSEQFKSNVPTEMLVRYTMTSGAVQYAFMQSLPASPTWSTFTHSITPPANTASLTVFHILHSTGSLEVDAFSLINPTAPGDTVAPAIFIVSPVSTAIVSGPVTVTTNATDNVGVAGVELLVDNAVVLVEDVSAPFTFTWDSASVANGIHTITARARDAAGNITTSSDVTVNVYNSVVSPPSGNLIADPYMDSIVTNPTQTDWLQGGWGTNNRIFSTDSAGPVDDGGKVEITTYTNGDAKWYFKDVAVTPNTTYTFSNYYQSNVPTELIARVTLANGSFQYVFMKTLPATTGDGAYSLSEVVTPANAVSMTVFHTLHSAGWLFVDTYKLYEGDLLPDVTAPVVAITSHDTEGIGAEERIRVLLHIDEGVSIAQSGIFVEGPTTFEVTAPASTKQPFSLYYDENRSWFIYPDTIPDGEYEVTAWARDAAGNIGSSTPVTVTIDNSASSTDTISPAVSITSHTGSEVISGIVTVTADATDNIAVESVEFLVASVNLPSNTLTSLGIDTTNPYSAQLDTSTLPDGSYLLIADAWDTSNNHMSVQVPVTVANTTQQPNLILNPSLETAGAESTPEHWFAAGWGSNTRTFTYPVVGTHGASAARVEMTNYIDGDAKWRFEDVAVTGGETYTMTHAYRSDVATNVTVRYTLGDGTFQYVSLGNRGVSLDWQVINHTFVVPANAVSMTVMHVLFSNGFLEVDEFSLVSGNTNTFSQGMVSFTFDDGWLSHYTAALPILDAANIDGTFYIVSAETMGALPYERLENADLEIEGEEGIPEGWFRGGWGTNTRVHTYPEIDATGGKAVRVEILEYTDGDAKWYFQDEPVIPAEDYIVKVSYKSNIPSVLIARYAKADGSFIYVGVQSLASTNDAWVDLVDSILVPDDVVSVTIFHVISEVGYLTTDNYSLKSIQDYVDPSQMLAIQASGHELGGHSRTHASMTGISLAEAEFEIAGSRNEILAMGGLPVEAFCYPFGDYNVAVQGLVEGAGYTSGRSVDRGFNTMATDKFALKIQSVNRETTMDDIQGWVNQAVADKTWLILMFHQIDYDLNQTLGVTPEFLTDIVNYTNTSSIDVVTVGEGVSLMDN